MDDILGRIRKDVRTQFDPNLARLFLDILPSIAYADIKSDKKIYHSPFSREALEIPADSFISAKRSDFERNGYRPSESYQSLSHITSGKAGGLKNMNRSKRILKP
jgi:hypothetical protein